MSPLSDAERHAKLLALEEWLAWQLQDTRRKLQGAEAQGERHTKLLTLQEWLVWQLQDTRRKLRALAPRVRQPSYILEKEIHKGHPLGATIHLVGCTMADRETRPIGADLAREGLTKDAGFFSPCEFCDPGKSLGIEKPVRPPKKRSGGMS